MNNLKKILVIFFLVNFSFAEIPQIGLWEYENIDENFAIEVYFCASELGNWHYKCSAWLVNRNGEKTNIILDEEWMEGKYYLLSSDISIIICEVENRIVDKKEISIDKSEIYSFRITSDSTGSFGQVSGDLIYELYDMKKKEIKFDFYQ